MKNKLQGRFPGADMHTANILKESEQGCIAILLNFDDGQNEQT